MKQNATATAKGFIYQFYEAIDWCWKLEKGESLFIETFGDISISNNVNIEVKNVKSDLTDMGESFWKTLGNWLDSGFPEGSFKTLILLTTQKIGADSQFSNWNSYSLVDRQKILTKIIESDKESYEQKLDVYNQKISSSPQITSVKVPKLNKHVDKIRQQINSSKLSNIVSKFIIMDSSQLFSDRYDSLCNIYGKAVLAKNVEMFINSQIGFILSPKSTADKWEITYDDFTNEINHLTQALSAGSRIFPRVINKPINTAAYKSHLFVKKINDIKHSDVVGNACRDYAQTLTIISDSFTYGEPKERFDSYLAQSTEQFDTLYRIKKRRCSKDINLDSQDFYDHFSLLSVPVFSGYDGTLQSFRNGLMHIQMDVPDKVNEPDKNKKWKLK
jgi:hypothetical protein